MSTDEKPKWWIFRGEAPHEEMKKLLEKVPPPPWREFTDKAEDIRAKAFQPAELELQMVNTAIYLRRPLLITGRPGVGKTTLASAVARELKLGKVLRWSITTQTNLREGLYRYDAIGRLQETSQRKEEDKKPLSISNYLRLGPLGTAFAVKHMPRVLLIDEIDKSDIDLPNDLLHIFEEGSFEIPELARLSKEQETVEIYPHEADETDKPVSITRGKVHCTHFPIVIMTSNGEREFPPAFLRRCLQLHMELPQEEDARLKKLSDIVEAHLGELENYAAHKKQIIDLIILFMKRLKQNDDQLATDQLLNAVYLVLKGINPEKDYKKQDSLINALWKALGQ